MRLTAAAVAALVAALAVPVVAAAPAEAEPLPCAGFDRDTTEVGNTPDPSVPYALLGVERATEILAERGRAPGQGVNVAVIDSGVDVPDVGLAPLTVVRPENFSVIDGDDIVHEHGTNVAGLVAAGEREEGGPTGIAPASVIYDLRVYAESDDAGFGGIEPDKVAAALDWLTANAEDEQIGVAVLALSLPGTPGLKRAVARLSGEDVVIVAGSGNRPEEGQDGFQDFGEQAPGENAAGTVFPAAYADDVFAVTSTAGGIPAAEDEMPDASGLVLRSSDIDAAVPTFGAVTLATNGSTCVVDGIATSWAAGIAGGVVALVRSAYPLENADQIEARLTASASG
ncbi:MAG: S8 family peptidase, partial [Nocardioides sp.]